MTLAEVIDTLQTWIRNADDEYDREEVGRVAGLKEALHEIKKIESCEDAVSRKDVHDMLENLPVTVENKWYNWLQKACMRLAELPPVTPQPKTGHWIEQIDHEENCRTLICSNCDRPALHDGDSIWKHKFCPHCGARMFEPQESED